MKKILLSLSVIAISGLVSRGQGTVQLTDETGGTGNVVINNGGTLSYAPQFTVALYYADVSGAATTASIGTDAYGQLTYSQFTADQASLGLTLGGTATVDTSPSTGGPGLFNNNVAIATGVPGGTAAAPVNDDLVLAAWTGNYSSLSAAEAGGAKVGLIGFSNPLGTGGLSTYIPVLTGWASLAQTPSDSAFETAQGFGVTANDLIMSAPTAVPEPGTLAMAGVGLASMLIFRRKK